MMKEGTKETNMDTDLDLDVEVMVGFVKGREADRERRGVGSEGSIDLRGRED